MTEIIVLRKFDSVCIRFSFFNFVKQVRTTCFPWRELLLKILRLVTYWPLRKFKPLRLHSSISAFLKMCRKSASASGLSSQSFCRISSGNLNHSCIVVRQSPQLSCSSAIAGGTGTILVEDKISFFTESTTFQIYQLQR